MLIFTDSISFAVQKLGFKKDYEEIFIETLEKPILKLAKRLFHIDYIYTQKIAEETYWQYLFIVGNSEESQFDVLTQLTSEEDALPDRILCIASEGKNFHGFKNRAWATLQGNLHLSIFLKPDKPIEHFASAFMVLPAVSVVETIDEIPSLKARAKIKWVNDILIDNAKVSGVISSTKIQGSILKNVVIGIGLNIEAKPLVILNEFVPEVTSIRLHIKNQEEAYFCKIFKYLIARLKENYLKIINSNYLELLEIYRNRSIVINKNVTIEIGLEQKRIAGKVINIGNDLELYISGNEQPIYDGRLIYYI